MLIEYKVERMVEVQVYLKPLTAAQVRTIINVEDGATADQTVEIATH